MQEGRFGTGERSGEAWYETKTPGFFDEFVIPRAACSGLESSLSSASAAGPSGRTEEEAGEGDNVESSGEEDEGREIDVRVEEGEGGQVETGEEGEE